MPISKQEKKKKKKKRLSNEDILKLIKKLKPKNQQTVRINIGDKGKSPTTSTPSYRPDSGSVVFAHAYAPPTPSPPTTPSAPLPPAPPVPMPTFNAPRRTIAPPPQHLALTAPENPYKPSRLATKMAEQFGRARGGHALLEEEEYSYSKAPAFKAPSTFQGKSSSLGKSIDNEINTDLSRFDEPYTNPTDEAGVRSSFNMSSDTWTLTPEGTAEPIVPASASLSMEDFLAQQSQQQELQLTELPPPPEEQPIKSFPKVAKTSEGRPTSTAGMITEINQAIAQGKFTPIGISLSNTYQTGKNKGLIRTNLSIEQLRTNYEALKESYK